MDAQQIKERFVSLGVGADWSRVEKITRACNDIAHYYTNITQSSLHTLIADAFVVIREFVRSELGEDPRTLLGDAAWQRMFDVAAVYVQERAESDALLQKAEWGRRRWKKVCGPSRARNAVLGCCVRATRPLMSRVVMECTACGAAIDAEGFVASAVEAELGWEAYVALKDGGEEPYTT